MKKPCRLDAGSTQQLKSLHHASQPRAGADISNASNNPPDVCLGRTFLQLGSKEYYRGNYNIIQNFAHFAKSYNDLQYHFVVFYYIIHFEMSISKSYATFVQNYKIIHLFCTSAVYHSCSCFGACHRYLPQPTALPPDNASEEIIPPNIGSLGCDALMTASNFNVSLTRKQVETQAEWERCQHLVTKLCNKLARIINVKATPDHPQRLIIPIVSPPGLIGHFFVACFDFSVHHPDFFVDISFYNSLERAQKRIKQASTCALMVKKLNFFQQIYIAWTVFE
jgi:hypothetical protein